MYTFHLDNKKIIKLDDDHILCKWSKSIQREKKNDVYLKASSEEFKMLIRIMELIMNSVSENEFIRKMKILAQLSPEEHLKKSLLLMYNLEIVPPDNFKVISKIPEDGSLANVIGPFFSRTHQVKNIIFGEKILSENEIISLMLYNQSH